MKTPICDFVRRYAGGNVLRLHMPGHKGSGPIGVEPLDITEIDGADSLYEAAGVIRESEENASLLFGSDTFYSTEGSSQCIRAMLYLAVMSVPKGKRPLIAAGRNAHKTFLSAAALVDADILWLCPERNDSYLSCRIEPGYLEQMLRNAPQKPAAVYVTSPDYLGNVSDIGAIAEVCHRYGILLLVDNAHGAYLRFLPKSAHPVDLGADMCCDSAHKTLPVLTGGAYLHISKAAAPMFSHQAKNALALFGSTSPSYLILQSLDEANSYLSENYTDKLYSFTCKLREYKEKLSAGGYVLCGSEPLKLTVSTKSYGYDGLDFARILRQNGIECEFADPDYTVMMFTPETGEEGLDRLYRVMLSVPRKPAILPSPPEFTLPERVMSVREAIFSPSEILPCEQCVGRVLASPCVGCPPAVPVIVCGERIDEAAAECFTYYGINECAVII